MTTTPVTFRTSTADAAAVDGPSMPGQRPLTAPPGIHVMAKPTGAICNLNGAYHCCYLPEETLYPGDGFRMSVKLKESTSDSPWSLNPLLKSRVHGRTANRLS